MKKKILILSDINGEKNNEWFLEFLKKFENHFDVKWYDSLKLAELDFLTDKEEIHQKMISRGIEKAVKNLIAAESKNKYSVILGFSIGGTIAWKSISKLINPDLLVLISSTRIRFETQKPPCKIISIYGENDQFKPVDTWFKQMDINPIIFLDEGHEFYFKNQYLNRIFDELIKI